MLTKHKKIKTKENSENCTAFSPQQDDLSVMKISNLLKPKTFTNKCKRCRISKLCLPAQVDPQKINTFHQLAFQSISLAPGETLCQQGELKDHLYAVKSGVLKSYLIQPNGTEVVIGFHVPPDIFGWEGINDEHRSVSIIALEHTNVCKIPLQQWEALTTEIPGLSIQLLQLVSQKVRQDNQTILKTTVEQRIANFLLRLTTAYQRIGYPDYLCKLPMSYRDIANYLRIAPETVTRTFKRLQTKEVIRLSRSSKRKLYIKDHEKLKSAAQNF